MAPIKESVRFADGPRPRAVDSGVHGQKYATSIGLPDPIRIAENVFHGTRTVYRVEHVQYSGCCELLSIYTDPADASLDSAALYFLEKA